VYDDVFSLFFISWIFQLIEQRDPFEYSGIQELVLALTSDEDKFIPVRRHFDPDILYIFGRMLDKVWVFCLFVSVSVYMCEYLCEDICLELIIYNHEFQ
jgi:hypothetical protein